MPLSSSHHEKEPLSNYSEQQLWNLVQRPSFTSSAPEHVWRGPDFLLKKPPMKNIWGEPIVIPFSYSYSSKPNINIDKSSYPFIPSVSFASRSPEDIWFPPKKSEKLYGWDFPAQGTQLCDNSSSGAAKPDEDISARASDEHVGGSSVNIHAGTVNKTCDGEFTKHPDDGEFNQPPGDVGSNNPLGDGIPFSGSQDGCRVHDSSAGACYMCGEAEHFATKCSLGCD